MKNCCGVVIGNVLPDVVVAELLVEVVDRLEVDVDIGPVDDVVLPGCAVYVTVVVAVTVEVGKFKLMIVVIVVLKLIVVGLLTVLVTCTV